MSVNKVAFTGNYAKTSNGNYYKKKNTGKRIATLAGLAGGISLAALPASQVTAMSLASKLYPAKPMKMFAATYGILGAGITLVALLCRAVGAIPDRAINKKRMAKADHVA